MKINQKTFDENEQAGDHFDINSRHVDPLASIRLESDLSYIERNLVYDVLFSPFRESQFSGNALRDRACSFLP